jgi:hypothetical protein
MKEKSRFNHLKNQSLVPREGTITRLVYDIFISHKGIPIRLRLEKSQNMAIHYLNLFYGMDIRLLSKGGRGKSSAWILAGEWINKIYIDYIAETLTKEAIDVDISLGSISIHRRGQESSN